MTSSLCCFLALASSALNAQEPVRSALDPAAPKVGQTVILRYFLNAPGANFKRTDTVYVSVFLGLSDHGNRKLVVELKPVGDALEAPLTLPDNAAHIQAFFVTRRASDRKAYLSAKVLNADGKPARNSQASDFGKNYQESIAKELEMYPDNYYAYRSKWFQAGAFDKENFPRMLEADMAKLTTLSVDPPELLATLVYGHALQKNEPASRATLKLLVANHPGSPLVARGFSDYEYQVFSNQWKGAGPDEVTALKKTYLAAHPDLYEFRDSLRYISETDPAFPIESVERGTDAWIKDQPFDPVPYLTRAIAYHKHNVKIAEASKFIEKGLNLVTEGYLRPYEDIEGQLDSLITPYAFREAAEIYLANGETSKALGAIRASQAADRTGRPDAWLTEGKIWRTVAYNAMAVKSYEEAYRRGSKDAEQPLRELYVKADGFDAYLAALKAAPSGTQAANPAAPAFSATSLDGKKYDLASLNGKVVVMNFWFIGCAPCRVEMPALNRLVDKYAKNQDVVFLGVALDTESELRDFLKKTKYAYNVVPKGATLSQAFGVKAYPTHIIIGRDGKVMFESVGGSTDIDADLQNRIDRALAGR
jgi:thiol-disulfide isomerase/thioredoxin